MGLKEVTVPVFSGESISLSDLSAFGKADAHS